MYDGVGMAYVESRLKIYVPVYGNLIRDMAPIHLMKEMVARGESIMIIDHDGPPRALFPSGMELTRENWARMSIDEKYPFGHGYVVAALVAGLEDLVWPPTLQKSTPAVGLKRKHDDDDD